MVANLRNSTRRIFGILLGGFLSIVLTGTLLVGSVHAGEGWGGGSGGVPGCEKLILATCFGAVWRWYPTSSNYIEIQGTVDDDTCEYDYVAYPGVIEGCGEYGGYWRYAWVAQKPGYNAKCGYSYSRGDQRGLSAIGNSYGTGDYASEYFDGPMKYRYGLNSNDGTWNEVREIYLALQAMDPNTYKYGWNAQSPLSWFCGPSTVEEVVPPVKYYTLTAEAYDTYGNSLHSIIRDQTDTVEEGYYASVTRGTAVGYTFLGFKERLSDSSYKTTSINFGDTLYSDETIYAIYEQQVFSGRARVSSGTTMGTDIQSTGFTKSSSTKELNIDCPNDGCNVAFDLALKREKGDGLVNFTVYRSQNGGSGYTQRTDPSGAFKPSTSGSFIKVYQGVNLNNPYVEKLLPGQSVCYYMTFSPQGNGNVTVKACAKAKTSNFQGNIVVKTPSGNESISYTKDSKTVIKEVKNCSPTAGCKVSFYHNLKRVDGIGSTHYQVSRTSNYSKLVSSNDDLKHGDESFSQNPVEVYRDIDLVLKPGQVVCESLVFQSTNTVISNPGNTTLKLCASALGKAQPDDPTNDPDVMNEDDLSDAFVDIRVKNTNGPDKYKGYQKTVYAKPEQSVTYRASYNPILQYTYSIIPQKLKIDSGSAISNSGKKTLEKLYNSNRGSYSVWRNAITVHGSGGLSSYSKIYSYTVGDTEKKKEKNSYSVKISDVGKDLAESASTDLKKDNDAAMTPGQVTFMSNGTNKENMAVVDTGKRTSIAHAYVPYNFDTKLEIKSDDKPIYAGEDKEIKYEIDVLPRNNPETTSKDDPKQEYATRIPNAISRVIIYRPEGAVKSGTSGWSGTRTSDVCRYFNLTKDDNKCRYDNEETGMLNGNGVIDGVVYNRTLKLSAPDLPAGTKICVAVATFPSNSGAYTNWDDIDGSHTWRISDSKCFLVAKRPSFQVWGGSLYAGGSIQTSAANKTTLRALPAFTGVWVFSSWVEQSVVAKGKVTALASGAATGLLKESDYPAGGGSHETVSNFCTYRVPLSLANYSPNITSNICTSFQSTGFSGIASSLVERKSLLSTLPNEDSLINNYSGNTTITINNVTEKNVIRYNVGDSTNKNDKSDVTINASTVNAGRTHIIQATGNVYINGNIYYQSSTFMSLEQIPKLIIYGKNIYISCGVRNIDAILIAEELLSTCESDDINAQQNSNQLTINGAIITNNLHFNRTYGAATGKNSKVPAEIVNYDASVLLWGRAKSDPDSQHKNLQSVYLHEIAPRY